MWPTKMILLAGAAVSAILIWAVGQRLRRIVWATSWRIAVHCCVVSILCLTVVAAGAQMVSAANIEPADLAEAAAATQDAETPGDGETYQEAEADEEVSPAPDGLEEWEEVTESEESGEDGEEDILLGPQLPADEDEPSGEEKESVKDSGSVEGSETLTSTEGRIAAIQEDIYLLVHGIIPISISVFVIFICCRFFWRTFFR